MPPHALREKTTVSHGLCEAGPPALCRHPALAPLVSHCFSKHILTLPWLFPLPGVLFPQDVPKDDHYPPLSQLSKCDFLNETLFI